MAINLATKTPDALKTMMENHERVGKTDADLYKAARDELARRASATLTVDNTVKIITSAAKKGAFVSYRTIADKSGVPWNRVHFAMTKHLLEVSRHAHALGWPMISAIVVNADHIRDGTMEPKTLAGFCACGRSLGLEVETELAFLRSQQAAVFLAAKEDRLT
jgi:hypothetical protein